MMVAARDEPVCQAIEKALQPIFASTHTLVWLYLENRNVLYSPSFSVFAPTSDNLIATGFKSRSAFRVASQKSHPLYNSQIDACVIPRNQPLLMLPIFTRDDRGLAVVQFSRKPEKVFVNHELTIASFLVNKFRTYGGFLFLNASSLHASVEATHFGKTSFVMARVLSSLMRIFSCRRAEVWKFDPGNICAFRYDPQHKEAVAVDPDQMGVAGHAMRHLLQINIRSVLDHPDRCDLVDGLNEEPVLVYPFSESSVMLWATVLRGKVNPPYFTRADEVLLRNISPFVVRSFAESCSIDHMEHQMNGYQQRLTALLEVAEALSGVLDIDKLIPLIMEKSCQLLRAKRCSLFLVDSVNEELVTRFAGGLSKSIRIPIGTGIVGVTATSGDVVNIPDAYADQRFDRSIDKRTGYRTRAILTVPIYNNRGDIAGVTEIINRIDGGAFDAEDVKLMMAFNVFCGIALDNAKLYHNSLDLARQLRGFVDMSANFNQKSTVRASIEMILERAREMVNAHRATLYLLDTATQELSPLVSIGQGANFKLGAAMDAVARGSSVMSIGDLESDPIAQEPNKLRQPESEVDADMSQSSRVMKMLQDGSQSTGVSGGEYLCAIPIVNAGGSTVGAMELASRRKMLSEDFKLLQSLAIFAAIAIERSRLHDLATLGQQEKELELLIAQNERQVRDSVPIKLRLNQEDTNRIFTVLFDSPQWNGVGHIKVIFAIFHHFGLQHRYGIDNEKLFRFLCDIRDTYNPVPYHNWRHAVDVTQFVTYQLTISHLEKVLTIFEVFAMMVSSLCHDANHDGFTNVYSVQAETPLGILFKNQSVMETHHCAVSIGILAKPQCNLFSELDPHEFKTMWTTIIQLILATDMARHFELVKLMNSLVDSGEFALTVPEHRILLMEIILKCGDISNVARPFELADKWCDVLCEEFFRQGDLESACGMEYTSPLNDRAHLDKPKSQIGFYTFVCLPLFQVCARVAPILDCNVKQVEANLATWKEEADRKANQIEVGT
jgi:GAF domain-containing protein